MNSKFVFGVSMFAACVVASTGFAINTPDDFDGDGKTDLAVYDSSAVAWYIMPSGGGALRSYGGSDTYRPVPADYDGDGKTDVAVYDRHSSVWYVLLSSNQTIRSLSFGGDSFRPIPADYDGDGKADLAVYERDTGMWYILCSSTSMIRSYHFGASEYRAIPGDYNGHGHAEPALYSRITGTWYILNASTMAVQTIQFGGITYRPVPGDYDGDHKTDLAVYSHAAGQWGVRSSVNGAVSVYQFGAASGRPAPGDYDGDHKTDLALYQRSSGGWYIVGSADGTLHTFQFGASTMAPLPAYNNGGTEGLNMTAFGDSITYGGGSSGDGPSTGYPILLERKLEASFGGHFASDNEGDPGEETADGLARLGATLDNEQPDIMLLMEGTNDHFMLNPYGQIESNLRAMVLTALGRGINVVIATIPPVISNQYRERSEQAAAIRGFNPRIYQIAADYGIPVAPVYENITSVPGWEQSRMDQPSANHPNDAGYAVIRDAFYQAVASGYMDGTLY